MKRTIFCAVLALSVAACGDAEKASVDAGGAEADVPAADTGAAGIAPLSQGPSFDCEKSDAEATDLVCSDAELAAMDRELARLYDLAVASVEGSRLNELKAMQRGWVKGRDDCWKADDKRQCVMASYAGRIHELRQGYAAARSDDAAGISNGPVSIACDGTDFGVSATFVQSDPGAVYLSWYDNTIALAHVPSGSGAKYAGSRYGETATLFTRGDEAILTLPGEPERNCKIEEIG